MVANLNYFQNILRININIFSPKIGKTIGYSFFINLIPNTSSKRFLEEKIIRIGVGLEPPVSFNPIYNFPEDVNWEHEWTCI